MPTPSDRVEVSVERLIAGEPPVPAGASSAHTHQMPFVYAAARTVRSAWVFSRHVAAGVLLSSVVAMAAHFLAGQHGGSTVLFALLLGCSLSFLSSDRMVVRGLNFAAKTLLGVGVVLLGARVTTNDLASLGWPTAFMVVCAVLATLLVGWLIGRLCGLGNDHAVLCSTAVAICGTTAALAVVGAIPGREQLEARALVSAVVVTAVGTAAMVGYPLLTSLLGLDDVRAGVFLGATIHNVAQVAGAGLMVSHAAAESAVIVKLLRVALLVPVVVVIAAMFAQRGPATPPRRPRIPWFLIGFVALAAINSIGALPAVTGDALNSLSSGCIATAVAALGLQTSGRQLLSIGWRPAIVVLSQSAFLAAFVGIWLFATVHTLGD